MRFAPGDLAIVVRGMPRFLGQVVTIVQVGDPNARIYDVVARKDCPYKTRLPWGEVVWGGDRHLRPLSDPDAAQEQEQTEELEA
jgi:hypothetical protein